MKIDYIIVGQGLAGSAVALELITRGKRIVVFDKPDENRASSVAAGLFNPITGRRHVKTWKADETFSCLHQFYLNVEKKLKRKFFYPATIYHPFASMQEQNDWMGKSADSSISQYIHQIFTGPHFQSQVNDPWGGVLLSQCGYLEAKSFMQCVREALIRTEAYKVEKFEEEKISFDGETVVYGDLRADKIIFCTGIEALRSSLFGWLPLVPLKGEVFEIRIDQDLKCIYNSGVYIVQTGKKGRYKVGSTYSLTDQSQSVTELARKELTDKLSDLLSIPFEITAQHWGIRPAIRDRRPVMGPHPKFKNMVIFNGLGTKGVSLAPYFSVRLVNWLEGKQNIEPEIDISRFYKEFK